MKMVAPDEEAPCLARAIRRGVEGVRHEGIEEKEGESYISSKTPLKEILNYANTLRQLTKGRGTYSMELSHYQEVPDYILEEILKEEKL